MFRLLLLVFLCSITNNSLACSCNAPVSTEEKFASADAVYVLTLMEVSSAPRSDIPQSSGYVTISGKGVVEEVLKGAPDNVTIESNLLRGRYDRQQPHSSCGSGITLSPFDTYIVFERIGEQPVVSICGGSAMKYEKRKGMRRDELRLVRKLSKGQD